MNFLAHAYFSFGHSEILVGNMISDFVKGKSRYDYSSGIQNGIELHRRIDAFTDNHPATKEGKEVFRKDYRLYSGALIDVVYDHFLANDKEAFDGNSLYLFTQDVYKVLQQHTSILPPKFLAMLPHMKQDNWLLNYGERWGIERSMGGLVRRSLYMPHHTAAFNAFNEQYLYLQHCYNLFREDVKSFAKKEFTQLVL